MNWDKVEKDIEKGPTGLFKQIFIFAFLGILVYLALHIIYKPAAIMDRVTNPDSVLYNYEYFYNQSEDYKAILGKVAVAHKSVEQFKQDAGNRTTWTFEDRTQYNHLMSIYTGLQYQCHDIVADYNAKAQQVTRNIFKTYNTPLRLEDCI